MSVTASEFFENAQNTGLAISVSTARRVWPGESVAIGARLTEDGDPIGIAVNVEEENWYVPNVSKQGYGALFGLDEKDQLDEALLSPHAILSHTIGEGVEVRKGDSYHVGIWPVSVESDGYLVKENGEWLFFNTAYYQATFGDKQPVKDRMIVKLDDEPFRYTILTEEVVFDFLEGEYTAESGMVLYENAEDEDGFTVVPLFYFLSQHAMLVQ